MRAGPLVWVDDMHGPSPPSYCFHRNLGRRHSKHLNGRDGGLWRGAMSGEDSGKEMRGSCSQGLTTAGLSRVTYRCGGARDGPVSEGNKDCDMHRPPRHSPPGQGHRIHGGQLLHGRPFDSSPDHGHHGDRGSRRTEGRVTTL